MLADINELITGRGVILLERTCSCVESGMFPPEDAVATPLCGINKVPPALGTLCSTRRIVGIGLHRICTL